MSLKPRSFSILLCLSLVLATFITPSTTNAASQVRITEIMYDPLGNGDKEFIEIYNGSDFTADLSGWSFSAGVNLTFAGGSKLGAGNYGVVVRERTVFSASYPNANILGQYVGKLVGRGELIKLVDNSGGLITQVDYRSGGGWPTAPRNGGPSLSLIRSNGDESQAGCWGSSTATGGSPGFANSTTGGGSCATKGYPTAPKPSGGGGGSAPQPDGGSGGTTTGPNATPPANNQPGNQNGQDSATQNSGDRQLENLTEAQKEELIKQDAQETQEDIEDEMTNTGLTSEKSQDPKAKKLAGLLLGSLVIIAGTAYLGLGKVAHSKNKILKKLRRLTKRNSWIAKHLKNK